MLKRLIKNFIQDEANETIAECFAQSFENCDFDNIEAEELKAIDNAIDELKASKILQKWAIDELSEYHKALRKEIKELEENYF